MLDRLARLLEVSTTVAGLVLALIIVQLATQVFELCTGDSIDYRSSTPHKLSNIGGDPAEVMWIISPPSY